MTRFLAPLAWTLRNHYKRRCRHERSCRLRRYSSIIAILQAGAFQAEADANCDLAVDFADIPAFIAILQN